MPVVISQHLLNVFVQLANKRGFKTKTKKKCHYGSAVPIKHILQRERPEQAAVKLEQRCVDVCERIVKLSCLVELATKGPGKCGL
jgi:hypothetical protein